MGGVVAASVCSRAQCDGVAVIHPAIASGIGIPADFGGSIGDVRHRDIIYSRAIGQSQLGQHQQQQEKPRYDRNTYSPCMHFQFS